MPDQTNDRIQPSPTAEEAADGIVDGVAIVGMSGRFPGAPSVAEFWKNQLSGVEAISQFSVEELELPDRRGEANEPNYVRARSVLDGVDRFDAEFFGILPKEAELMDPQHRLFLECCSEAFEDAGYDPFAYAGSIGVVAGSSYGSYFHAQVCAQPGFREDFVNNYQIGNYPAMMGNHPDYLATRVSYKFNLRGPSFAVQSACSTSLVAVCQACQSLLTYQSDMMLAGGVSITLPQKRGYLYVDGGMGSADGHCRPFDADAQGTVFGSGVGVVLLKRLADAIADGDQIYSVIRGFATNNDGATKIGYTAPSIDGQASVVAMAQQTAGVDARSIGYIEAHGTATPLGDPIELAALEKAFRTQTEDKDFCVIGTAKANVGHLDIAAGVTGLIHAAHVVRHGRFPATLHFKKPNVNFDLRNSPFRVYANATDWERETYPRRAGVSSFGVGGTNAHVILEEPPPPMASLRSDAKQSSCAVQLLTVSTRSPEALDRATRNLIEHLELHPALALDDVAYTLQVGRRAFDYRRAITADSTAGAITALQAALGQQAAKLPKRASEPEICFLFPGQGSQYAHMGRDLYRTERVFREELDACAALLRAEMDVDLLQALYPEDAPADGVPAQITQTFLAQPALFAVEYALARLWMSWGIKPQSMIGHSIGEFVAACLAGVFTLADALHLIAVRGRLMQGLPPGMMLSVRMSEADLMPLLGPDLSIAAVNAPLLCVVSGRTSLIEGLEQELTGRGTVHRRLHTSHAFHSAMVDPILEAFHAEIARVHLAAPQLPYVSSVTGTWVTPEEATSPAYWTHHLRDTVRFAAGMTQLQEQQNRLFLEVGPGNVLATLARQNPIQGVRRVMLSSLSKDADESLSVRQALGELWVAGAKPDWQRLHAAGKRQRVSLPTYPFERKRFWLEAPVQPSALSADRPSTTTLETYSKDRAREIEAPVLEATAPMPQLSALSVQTRQESLQTRQESLRATLVDLFEDLSGLDISGEDRSMSFLELGFDSLFLTQVTQALQSRFALKITFRQLLGQESTLDVLAAYIDEKLAPGLFEPVQNLAEAPASTTSALPVSSFGQVSVPTSAPFTGGGGVSGSINEGDQTPASIDQLMRDQMQALNQLFAQQLSSLSGAMGRPSASLTPASPATPLIASAPISTPTPTAGISIEAANQKQSAGVELVNMEPVNLELKGYTPFKPLQKSVSGDLTPKQTAHIENLIRLYTSRTATSKSKTQAARQFLADPRVVAGFRIQWKEMVYPIITAHSKGSHLWDIDGNEYVDILNGFGPIMLGHRPAYVEEAIERQLRDGFETGPQTLLAGEVAQALCAMTGNERATFCNTGSEAVIAAMRIARTVTGKNRVVFFAGDYHGMFDEVLVKGITRGGQPQSIPLAPGIPRESVANVTVLEYGAQESLNWIQAHAGEIAAVLVEPVQSRHPNLRPIAFLKELRTVTEETDTCLIFDEVVTGFRVHPGGCQALFEIRADLATYGKVLAGGMPIGVLAGKARYMDALDGGMWQYGDDSSPETGVTFFAGTFVRHPLAMAACAAVLKHLKQEGPGLQERLTARTTDLIGRLNALLTANDVPTRIESFASFFYFSFASDFRFGSLFYFHLRAKGIHLLENFPCFLTTEHSDQDLDRIVRAFQETIAEMQAGEVLPLPVTGNPLQLAAVARDVDGPAAASAPITESQMEILLSAQLSSEANCSYNESFTLHLTGQLDEAVLTDSLSQLLARYDALRATFDLDQRTQYFHPPTPAVVSRVDLSHRDAAAQKVQFDGLITEDAHRPFDLIRGPLVRWSLVRFAPDRHALICTAHHVVFDGWSINVLLEELSQVYSARLEGREATLPALMPFSTYARAQETQYAGEEGTATEAFWLKQFEILPPLLDLPIDHPRPPMKSFSGATYRRAIGLPLLKEIKRAGAQQKCTLFVTLLGGFVALLGRLSGQSDIVVGVPAAGQSLVEEKVLVGHCVNFVPMRGTLDDTLTTAQFLAQMRATVFDAYDHQNYTFGRLVRNLPIRRDASRLPLLEVQFNLEKLGSGLRFSGLEVYVDSNPKSFVNFDLFFNVVESGDGLTLHVDYNTTLIDEATLARWVDCYEQMLTGFTADAAQQLSRLNLLTARERDLVSVAPNQTDASFPSHRCVHQLFEQQVAATPHAIAVQFETQTLTYASLNASVNKLAQYLVRSGVRPGDTVGVYMERSIDMIVGLLATWKAGAAYIPLDPTFPPERLRMVFEDVSGPIVLTQSKLAGDLPSSGVRILSVDERRSAIEQEAPINLNLAYDSAAVAYVIYTSGSTGRPKGVEVTHASVVNLLTSMARSPGLSAKDVLVAVTTISFDIAALEIYLPLVTGAKLVLATRPVASDGVQLLKLLRNTHATVMQATPVTFRLLLAAGWKGEPRFTAWCGGEALPRELAEQILACEIVLWNMYGPTETTIWSAIDRVVTSAGPVPIGPPIDNTQFYVLDAHQELVPVGVAGELCIGGAGVARGYLQRADLTARKFISDPFSARPGARLYRTGDLVRRLRNGEFEFLGRADSQIKLRGFRIELGEIESVLTAHEALAQAIVTLHEDRGGDKRIVAYMIPRNGSVPPPNELRSYLLMKLPDYMVPAAFISMPSFPLTANGKIDRRALPAPDWDPVVGGHTYVAPRSTEEAALAKIWGEVLHLDRVGVEDNIFELGADSLHVFQITARASQAGIDVKPRQILQYRTIAAVLADMALSGPAVKSAPLMPVSRAKYRIAGPQLTAPTEPVDAWNADK